MSTMTILDRRDFVKLGAAAGGGLVLGVHVEDDRPWAPPADTFQPNAFVRIDTDGAVTIWLAKAEMGQGVRTSLPMIVADELDADWSKVRVVQADAHPNLYGRQMTVGSGSVRRGAWIPLRQAGAAAREMLVAAAAARWGIDKDRCRTDSGSVINSASGHTLSYGALVEDAIKQAVPQQPRLKDPSEFRLIGRPIPHVDTRAKVTGAAGYGMDIRVPNMVYATVVHCPVFGGSVKTVDATRAKQVPGVLDVVPVSQGVAVVADNTWAAFEGAKALDVTWNTGEFSMSSADISASFVRLAAQSGAIARQDGDADRALGAAAKRLSATYEVPYLAHATMEPMNCTADVRSDRCEIWVPTQNPQGTQSTAARITGLSVDQVTVHVTYLGCGLGRRSRMDFVEDAVETSLKVDRPVQLVWTREEDMQHDFYRPATYNTFEGGIDTSGRITAWKLRIVATPVGAPGRNGAADPTSVAGAADMAYQIPNVFIDNCRSTVAVPTGYWRSVGPSQNTFIVESFMDELAHAAGRDPFEVRRELLAHYPRLRRVLELAADRAGWGTPLPAGRARGIALVEDKGGLVAQVAEVSLESGRVRVHRVTCAADCGLIIHPEIARAQMVGSIVNGLSAALFGEITIDRGRVVQSNFHDYQMLRMSGMPEIEVHLVDSTEEPGGVGEPAVPPIAPAVTNALFVLTGKRIRKLPIRADMISAGASESNGA